ncbi:MAG TPA: glutamate-1-semialdehyde 2,1-aminomutase [candidate division Zixibacteria bacterium]|nr:glutamate-1-semialdehyde 2,1-aminomutase [candidate division Zixibacteria bacterium]
MRSAKSRAWFRRAQRLIPGGVNSPVRAWKAVGGHPVLIASGNGSRVRDVDGNEYVDFVGSWGPLILGHRHPRIVRAVRDALQHGTTFGAPTTLEVRLAELISKLVPSIEKVRLVSSGTEATMSALRLARAFTGRPKIVKFDGCYHGHADGLLVRAGSGAATFGLPDSPGVVGGAARETIVAAFNDSPSVERLFARYGSRIAAVIVEPVCGNMGVIPPQPGFLSTLRDLTRRHHALLIFDEVITGFRLALGGAQELYRVRPDLTCLGKIAGGGLPLAAFGGRREIMDLLAPDGPVYQAGTLSGNPLSVAAGLATLEELARDRNAYRKLERKSRFLEEGFTEALRRHDIAAVINRVGSMMTVFFGVRSVRNAADARRCDRRRFAGFFHGMLRRGIYLPPAPFEAAFVSLAHSRADLERAVDALDRWAAREGSG